MEKKDLVSLMLGTAGVLVFALGMCMCLLPQWQMLGPGIWLGCVGALILAALVLVRRKMENKPLLVLNARSLGLIALGAVGALTLGVGLCLVMIWPSSMVWGFVVGCVGFMLLVSLIPICKGIK